MMKLNVFADQTATGEFNLSSGKQSIGSAGTCDIVIGHSEVNALAMVVDVSGSAIFVENRNEYPIYVGQQLVDIGGMAEWPAGATIGLTRSVSLQITDTSHNLVDPASEEGTKNKSVQNTIQVAVIIVCAALSFFMLANDKGSAASTSSSDVKFDDLIEMYESVGGPDLKKLSYGHRVLLGYLTEARTLERRWGRSKRDEAREAYEIILRSHLISSVDSTDVLASETRQFTSNQLSALR